RRPEYPSGRRRHQLTRSPGTLGTVSRLLAGTAAKIPERVMVGGSRPSSQDPSTAEDTSRQKKGGRRMQSAQERETARSALLQEETTPPGSAPLYWARVAADTLTVSRLVAGITLALWPW